MKQFLERLYKSKLLDVEFDAVYKGERADWLNRSTLEVDDDMAAILRRILGKIEAKVRPDEIWTAFTGPEDSDYYENYWLWVEPVQGLMEEGHYTFKVTNIQGFTNLTKYKAGVSITVERI